MDRRTKAIFFDLDGVLIDSIKSWFYAFNKTLRKFGLSELSEREFRERCWGYSLKESLGKKFGLGDDAVKYCNESQIEFIDEIRMFPDGRKVLNRVRNKFKIGLITNTPKKNTRITLRRFRLENYFDVIITGDDVRKPKPDPEMIVKGCKLLNVTPDEAVVIGDTKSDFLSGRSAGCKVIGLKVKGDIEIKKLSDLPDVLEKLESPSVYAAKN